MRRPAFTLVELLVVIAIIGLLSTVAVVATNAARVNSRNASRKANLLQISKALELYFTNNGGYPSTGGAWWGVCSGGGNFAVKSDSGAGGWIPNLSPAYLAVLPRDPNTGKANPSSTDPGCRADATLSCFVYQSDGVNYKLSAYCTPEGSIGPSDPFYDTIRPAFNYSVFTPGAAGW